MSTDPRIPPDIARVLEDVRAFNAVIREHFPEVLPEEAPMTDRPRIMHALRIEEDLPLVPGAFYETFCGIPWEYQSLSVAEQRNRYVCARCHGLTVDELRERLNELIERHNVLVDQVQKLKQQVDELRPQPLCRNGRPLQQHTGPCDPGCEYPAPPS